jgi:predicted permease
MPGLLQDIQYGWRTLRRTPGFTLTAIAVLALGLGVNATVFSLANAFFFRPLPVAAPDTLVRVYSNRYSNTPWRTYLELRDRNSTLSGLAAFQLQSYAMTLDRDVEHVFGQIVSGEYFPVLGVTAAHGRLLGPADDRPGAPPAVVLSHAFWIRRFGGSPDALGRSIRLNDRPFTIVGVAAQGFNGVMAPVSGDLWVPLGSDMLLRPGLGDAARLDTTSLHLIGRLKPGIERRRAEADLDAIGRQLRAASGDLVREQAITLYAGTTLHPEIAAPVTVFTAALMTVVMLVLLIVCVNMANLVLARAAGRDVELAIRQSLGAGRGRLIRQLLTESLLLSLGGAAAGLTLALLLTRLLTSANLPTPVPISLDLSLDVRVLAFTTLAAVAATIAFGMAPALTSTRIDVVSALKQIGSDGPRHGRLRAVFLVAQVSMSVLLLIVAGLFIRGFTNARSIDLGFETAHVLTATVDLGTRGYTEARGVDFLRSLTERLEATPGVAAASVVDIIPVTLSNTASNFLGDGDAEPGRQVYLNAIGPGHFRTLNISLAAGRDFTHQDTSRSAPVGIVNETLARQFWPGKNAVGQRLRSSASAEPIVIVGVVRDSKYVTISEAPRPFMYRPFSQSYSSMVSLMVRATGAPLSALPAVRNVVHTLDPGLAVFNVATLEEATSLSLLPSRVAGGLLGALGLLALVLAALGIHGVLSFLVRARTREIGLRVAIGATPRMVVAMVLRQAATWTALGAGIGIALALAATRFLASFLYGISPTDPATFAGVTLMLTLVAGIAAYMPARRASRLDPLAALRNL